MDLRPKLEAAMFAFALPAVVTPPDGDPVETEGFWLRYETKDTEVAEFRRSEARRVLVLSRADVPQVPRGTVISMPEFEGGPVLEWRSDAMESFHPDHYRIIVLPHQVGS